MHILFLTDNFPPEVNAPASRTFEHGREWVKAGHKVTVITCAPNFPSGKVFNGYRNKIWQTEEMAGIRVIRVWSFISANEGFVKRVLDYVSYMISAIIASLFVPKVEVVIGTSPQFFTACAAYVVSKIKRRPWIFELRDLWPESIRAVGAMKKSRALDLLEKLELFLYGNATAIVTVTNSFKDNLIKRGVEQKKIFVITNGVDLSRFSPSQKDQELVKKYRLENKFVAGYIGTHGMAHGLDTILETAKIIKKSKEADAYHIIFLGDGAEKARLAQRATMEQIDNVLFIDTVPKEDVARYWTLLDVSIIHLKKTDLFKTVIPSKLFESMGMGVPILLGVSGESASIVNENEVGMNFEPENPDSLKDAIFSASNIDLETWRKRCSAGAKKYDRSFLAKQMLQYIEKTLQQAQVK